MIVTPRLPSFFCTLSLFMILLLSACGGSSDSGQSTSSGAPPTQAVQPAAALAQGLEWIDVQDSSGQIIMQHRFSAGADADEEVVTTTQRAGSDGIWGTADDWRTAEVHCRYQPGEALDTRLLLSATFQPESFLSVGGQACLWRRPLAGDIGISGTGGYFESDAFQIFDAILASPTGQILFAIAGGDEALAEGDVMRMMEIMGSHMLGPLLPATGSSWTMFLGASRDGLRNCPGLCEEIEVMNEPADTVCNVNCTGLDNIVYNPYVTPLPAGVSIFNGTQQYPVYEQGRLVRLVKSIALEKPLAFPSGYEAYAYTAAALREIDSYVGPGADVKWFTADDVLGAYLGQQQIADGWQRIYYSAAGVDGVWKTGDDEIARTVSLHQDGQGRIASVQVCTAPGTDAHWQTADDICKTILFHYSPP